MDRKSSFFYSWNCNKCNWIDIFFLWFSNSLILFYFKSNLNNFNKFCMKIFFNSFAGSTKCSKYFFLRTGILWCLIITCGQSVSAADFIRIFSCCCWIENFSQNSFQWNVEWKPIPWFQFDVSYHLSYSSLLELVAAPFSCGLCMPFVSLVLATNVSSSSKFGKSKQKFHLKITLKSQALLRYLPELLLSLNSRGDKRHPLFK